jgi:hypothetical protein
VRSAGAKRHAASRPEELNAKPLAAIRRQRPAARILRLAAARRIEEWSKSDKPITGSGRPPAGQARWRSAVILPIRITLPE